LDNLIRATPTPPHKLANPHFLQFTSVIHSKDDKDDIIHKKIYHEEDKLTVKVGVSTAFFH